MNQRTIISVCHFKDYRSTNKPRLLRLGNERIQKFQLSRDSFLPPGKNMINNKGNREETKDIREEIFLIT